MRNHAIKFSILSQPFRMGRLGPQDFLEYTPEECWALLKRALPEKVKEALFFAFTDTSLLQILDEELDVDIERPVLVFRKGVIDARSVELSAQVRKTLTPAEDDRIQTLAQWLFDATRVLYRQDLPPARVRDIQEEYKENLRLYAAKYAYLDEDKLTNLVSYPKLMLTFCHAMAVDALFKADAATALFGPQSGYAQAWKRKEVFRHRMTTVVQNVLTTHTAREVL